MIKIFKNGRGGTTMDSNNYNEENNNGISENEETNHNNYGEVGHNDGGDFDNSKKSSSPFALLTVLFSPVRTYENFRENPKFVLKLLFVILLATVLSIAMIQMIMANDHLFDLYMQDMQEQMEAGMEGEAMPDEFADTVLLFGLIIGVIGTVFIVFIGIIIATVFIYLFSRLAKMDLKFTHVWAIVTVAQGPVLLLSFISLFFIEQQFVSGGAPVTSLAFMVDGLDSPFLSAFFANVEVFTIWSYVLIGLGLSIFAKTSYGKGIAISFIYFFLQSVVIALFVAGAAALTSNIMM